MKILNWYPLNYPSQLSVCYFKARQPLKCKIEASSTCEQMLPHRGLGLPALWPPSSTWAQIRIPCWVSFWFPTVLMNTRLMRQWASCPERPFWKKCTMIAEPSHQTSCQRRTLSRWGSSQLLSLRLMPLQSSLYTQRREAVCLAARSLPCVFQNTWQPSVTPREVPLAIIRRVLQWVHVELKPKKSTRALPAGSAAPAVVNYWMREAWWPRLQSSRCLRKIISLWLLMKIYYLRENLRMLCKVTTQLSVRWK